MRLFGRKKKDKGDALDDLINRETKYWRDYFQKEREEEAKRIKAYHERKDKAEAEILAKIKANMPDLRFRACPWCGEEPHIEVRMMPVYRNCGLFSMEDYDADFKSYRVELMCCKHLDEEGMAECLNTYDLPYIPDQPTFPNPDYRWDKGWNGANIPFEEYPLIYDKSADSDKDGDCLKAKCYRGTSGKYYSFRDKGGWGCAVNEHIKYLADDYEEQCSVCHKKWRGYEELGDCVYIDGVRYCRECATIKGYFEPNGHGKTYAVKSLIRDALNIDSLYIQDNCPKFYTSLETCLKSHGLTEEECYTLRVLSAGVQGADALSGHISGDHWEIWKKNTDPKLSERSHWNLIGFVFDPGRDVCKYEILRRD